jgi:hypothetical protein
MQVYRITVAAGLCEPGGDPEADRAVAAGAAGLHAELR